MYGIEDEETSMTVAAPLLDALNVVW